MRWRGWIARDPSGTAPVFLLSLSSSVTALRTLLVPSRPVPRRFRLVHFQVNMVMREIRFYRSWGGRSPVLDLIRELTPGQKKKAAWVLTLVESQERVSAEYFKKLPGTDDLWEVRARFRGDEIRMLGFFDGPLLVVLVSGFVKKTRQTPRSEIERAHARKQEYLGRKGS